MKQIDAMALIKNGIDVDKQQHWADLGCGNGTLTEALFHLLPKGSTIEAVDQEIQHLGIPVNFIQANFETDNLILPPLDGILMANSLHYIKDKKKLIHKLESYFVNDRTFLIVEYDTDVANPWVPYPLSFQSITTLFTKLGYNRINKLGSQSSIYKRAEIYAVLIQS